MRCDHVWTPDTNIFGNSRMPSTSVLTGEKRRVIIIQKARGSEDACCFVLLWLIWFCKRRIRFFRISFRSKYSRIRNLSGRNKRQDVRGTSSTERDPEEGIGRGEGSLNRGDVRMLGLGDSGPGDGQRARFPGLVEPQERRLRQVSLRSESVDGHEHQLVSRILTVLKVMDIPGNLLELEMKKAPFSSLWLSIYFQINYRLATIFLYYNHHVTRNAFPACRRSYDAPVRKTRWPSGRGIIPNLSSLYSNRRTKTSSQNTRWS